MSEYQVGDKVYITPSGYGNMRPATVTRVTATQVVAEPNRGESYRFVIKTGRQVGGDVFHPVLIKKRTPRLRVLYREEQVANALMRLAYFAGRGADRVEEARVEQAYRTWQNQREALAYAKKLAEEAGA